MPWHKTFGVLFTVIVRFLCVMSVDVLCVSYMHIIVRTGRRGRAVSPGKQCMMCVM